MICPKCKQALPDDSEFCQYCGSKLKGESVSVGNAAPASSPELAGKTCPFCKAPFMEGEAVVFCSHCEMPHHLECWKENGGCTTFGCTGNIGKIIGAEQKNAQSAPVATRRPANTELPQTIPYPQTRTITDNKQQVNQTHPVGAPARPVPQVQYTVLAESTEKVLQANLPVMLVKTVLRKGSDGKLDVTCGFQSLADKVIQAMQIDVKCADIWRESVKPAEGHQYLDLNIRRDEVFGEDERIAIPDPNTRVVEVSVRKIMFSDGTLLLRDGENIKVPDPVPLKSTLEDDLLEEYKCQTYQNVCFEPIKLGSIWRCTCGAFNLEEEGECHSCGDYLANLMSHLDRNLLQSSIDEKKRIQREKEERERIAREEALRRQKEEAERVRREYEERLRIKREREAAEAAERKRLAEEQAKIDAENARIMAERKKQRNRKIAIICSAAAMLALIVYLIGWQMIPSIEYKKAEDALTAGDYDAAYQGFLEVGGYRDGKERACAIRYEQGETALKAGDYDSAYLFFSDINGYNDSYIKAKEATYCKASDALNNKEYDTAYNCFASIIGYSDSETMAKEALYQKGEKLIEEESFAEAQAVFEQIKEYKDSGSKVTKCEKAQKYQKADELFQDGKYKESGEAFAALLYRDSKERAKEAYYCYAKELIEQGKTHEAYEILAREVNTGTSYYEDSIELANQVEYQYASECFAAGKYDTAYNSFGNIIGYEDSETRCLESGYQYALQLFEKQEYVKAGTAFSKLDKYKDSIKQANESFYQNGLLLQKKEKWDLAEKQFSELGNYRDSATQIKETKYQHALALLNKKEYIEAEKLFEELGYYSDSAKQAKESKYQRAQSLLKDRKYTQAVPIFKELGNYSDSFEQWKSAMWSYVFVHDNNDDWTTYEYLTELKRYNYKDSKKTYENLYTWKVTGYITTSATSTTHLTSVSTTQKYVRVTYKFSGGTPGENVTIKTTYTWPNGYSAVHGTTYTIKDGTERSIIWDDYLWTDLKYATKGSFTIKFYNKDTGALIGSLVFKLT